MWIFLYSCKCWNRYRDRNFSVNKVGDGHGDGDGDSDGDGDGDGDDGYGYSDSHGRFDRTPFLAKIDKAQASLQKNQPFLWDRII